MTEITSEKELIEKNKVVADDSLLLQPRVQALLSHGPEARGSE